MIDFVNGLFEFGFGLLCLINIIKLKREKKIMGVSWIPTMYSTIWGIWSLYYYISITQIYSFLGCMVIFIMNAIWVGMVFYYKKNEKGG